MTDQLSFSALRALDANGDAAAGAKAYVYETGTTTPVTVYTDTGLSVAHASPIVANSAGIFAQAFYGGATALKVVVTDANDATLYTLDPVPFAALETGAASQISFSPTAAIPVSTVQAAIERVQANLGVTAVSAYAQTILDDTSATAARETLKVAKEFISSQDASASAQLDFTGFDGTKYDAYEFELINIVPATNSALLYLRTSTDGGSTFESGASDYSWGKAVWAHSGGTGNYTTSGNSAADLIAVSNGISNTATTSGVSATLRVHGPHLAAHTTMSWHGMFYAAGGSWSDLRGSGARLSNADVDAIRFYFSSGNIASGTITMYGLRNAG